jgi:glycosyltransferase involved in cell wall biosynthesis
MPAGIHELILVDGHSVDDTVRVARELWPGVRVVMQTRSGKGNALACGFAAATGDVIAVIDADGSADPGEIPQFVKALVAGADFAKGTRFARGGGSHDITRLRSLGNRALCKLVNVCYGTRYTDLCYGFNVFWRHITAVLGLDATTPPAARAGPRWGDGFEVETLINVRVAAAGLVITEVGSFEHPRIHGVSNLNAFRDGLRVLRTIVYERLTPRRPRPAPATPPPRPGTAGHPRPEPGHAQPQPRAPQTGTQDTGESDRGGHRDERQASRGTGFDGDHRRHSHKTQSLPGR